MSARDTALAESAQAIFCSMADYLGAIESSKFLNHKTYTTFSEFENSNRALLKKALTRVKVDVGIKDVYEYLIKNPKWYVSSILIANALVRDLKTIDKDFNISQAKYNDGKMFYLRGDEEVMNLIGKLFSIANKSLVTQLLKKDIPNIIGF